MRSSLFSQLVCRCRRASAAVFGLMTRDDWLFLASIICFHSLLVVLVWVVFAN
ncbi:hypothetical protein AB7M56_006774 [Bradyrhizobium elkanii]|nr:hypothetical protein [Bradyrhizobium elkanii]MCS3519948.1 hypothetical protein [Bradyrhizobium elkanii]MCS4067603.1 hypothetical protein [Bradyrhizobium elkanii]MCS4083139.1 hypothetical protein [Bradyrhizobium elkanii]MCS4105740.1 hypothetical protein [Bradyrhizobium elkanii]